MCAAASIANSHLPIARAGDRADESPMTRRVRRGFAAISRLIGEVTSVATADTSE